MVALDEAVEAGENGGEDFFGGLPMPRGKLGKALAAYGVTKMAWSTFKDIKGWYEGYKLLTISLTSDDPLYEDVLEWLAGSIMPQDTKSISILSGNKRSYYDDEEDTPRDSKFKVVHDDSARQKVTIGGHKVFVQVAKQQNPVAINGAQRLNPDRVIFSTKSMDAYDAIMVELTRIMDSRQKKLRPPRLYSLATWGGFQSNMYAPTRALDTVILRKGQLERIIGDMEAFLLAENDYVRRGIPWHRGYLLHGVPGTGKTSVTKAIAGHFGLDLYVLPIGDLKNDTSISKLLSEIPAKSVLLLEDVDVFRAATQREDEDESVSMSGLLNALDGVSTPHGLITIMTTNDKSKLDPALLRAGRIDLTEELDVVTREQGQRMVKHFYGLERSPNVDLTGRTPADILEVLKRHMYDESAALREFRGK